MFELWVGLGIKNKNMNKLKYTLLSVFLMLTISSFSQSTITTTDTTGKLYVMIVRSDSIAVVYQGKQSVYTTDEGLFMKNFSAFDLKLKGFFKEQKLFPNLSDVINPATPPIVIVPPIEVKPPTVELETNAYPIEPNFENKIYSTESGKYSNINNSDKNINGMTGYDFSPIVLNKSGNFIDKWRQSYLSIKGQKDIWKEGDLTYFLKPKGYSTNTNYNLMDFDIRFPDFTLPNNKYVILQPTPSRERNTYNYLKKGVSFAKGKNDIQGFTFDADRWLYDLGCPPAYVATQESFDKWCNEVDSDLLLQSFIQKIYYPCRNLGYVMLNWEAVSHRWNVRKDKIIRCLEFWQNNPHQAKMSLWTVSKIKIPKPWFDGYNIDFSYALNHNGDINDPIFRSFVQVYDDYSKYVEVSHIGGYQNYPNEDGVIHHYLSELIVNRNYSDKIHLATIWFDQEPINNFGLDFIKVNSESGGYLSEVKPRVTPSTAFNWGVWTVAIGDGLDCWSDPYYWTENKNNWGTNAFDMNGNRLNPQFGNDMSKYPAQPMKNIDWLMSGVWTVSENKDIVNSLSKWQWKELPTKSYFDKSVLIAYKVLGNEALVLALDNFGKIDGETTHQVNIEGKNYQVKTFGRYTSVIRLKL